MNSPSRAKVIRARELRKEQTKAERELWWLLRNRLLLGHKFRRQYVFHGFILDFYCPSARLAVELDGPVHDEKREYDTARQKAIELHQINILRFTNDELKYSPVDVLNKIISNLPISALSTLVEREECLNVSG